MASTSTAQHVHSSDPLNREPPLASLLLTYLTPPSGYVRTHSSIPHLSAASHKITLNGLVNKPITISISDLQSLPQTTVTCALQCAGNRRSTMSTHLGAPEGIQWHSSAVLNATWSGVLLSTLLIQHCDGVTMPDHDIKTAHVAFACHAVPTQDDSYYGGSIPLSRALRPDADVLLATSMNGEPLTPEHGYPVRIITPGVAGARSVKWVDTITVQRQESECFYQKRDYKVLPESVKSQEDAEGWWDRTEALMDMPVNSVVGIPESGDTVARIEGSDEVEIEGWALPSGEDGPVVKVEVSGDEGQTWVEAEFTEDENQGKWAWVLWKARVKMEEGTGRQVWSRATDKAGNTQEKESQWNLRGCAYNGYGLADGLTVT